MAKKMLIDATHPEETRVVVVDGTKVEEFDFETVNKRQLAGNIYLAKVTRVEPSLQAAFVDYGGNRHGFLAFAEIHPDYYQIPAADRQALLDEDRANAEAAEAEETARENGSSRRSRRPARAEKADSRDPAVSSDDVPGMQVVDPGAEDSAPVEGAEDADSADDRNGDRNGDDSRHDGGKGDRGRGRDNADQKDDSIESVADEDVTEEINPPRKARARRYKIQEVIKVRQIMLVQVVKEERGNKGAALTTYLSLAGRYCVLMPNTARGGGISRKITNAADRKKLKEIAGELRVPQGAGLIIRTAGSQRTRTEIKRDYEYLMRLWEQIRELTFASVAPAPIYEEGDLIKRTIRDLYSREIDEVLVEGERGYRVAKDFMKMIMPSHARNVKHYTDQMPLFARYQVEGYLAGMFNPVVQLKSGGYIVIGVTEALVAIDVNSGRATKEGSIEDTATKTNLEACDEVARQLRLRDLAGLIVIDFIDMDERKNNAAVEKRLKDRLKTDRARIQVGRISGFGLMEMSRQRLRPGMLESTTQPCAHCHGTGLIRSDDSLALTILRAIEEEGTRKRTREVLVKAPVAVANFLMNAKRDHIATIEARYGMSVRVEADPVLISPDFAVEKFKTATRQVAEVTSPVVSATAQLMAQIDDDDEADVEDEDDTATAENGDQDSDDSADDSESGRENGDGSRSKRRRRRRRGGRGRGDGENGNGSDQDSDDNGDDSDDAENSDSRDGAAREVADSDAGTEAKAKADSKPAAKAEPQPSRSRSRTRTRPTSKAATDAQTQSADDSEKADEGKRGDDAAQTDATPAPERDDREQGAQAPSVKEAASTDANPEAAEDKPAEAAPEAQQADNAPAAPEAEESAEPDAEVAVEETASTDAEPEAADSVEADAKDSAEAATGDGAKPGHMAEAEEPAEADQSSQPKRRGWWSVG
ncbi:ribonuclease E/G [Paracoccus jeotgali]|uniref:ribonuclease E/G n=1 Tax=Paracoccus jeotgali TaxID=2065379 RepID=UPI0028A60388|nr:Rne/Rng family ribonuclease [Paracoccus jeotgali]